METTPLTHPYQTPNYIIGSESKTTYWIKTIPDSNDPLSALYEGQALQKEKMVMGFSKILSSSTMSWIPTLEFIVDGTSVAKLFPNQNCCPKTKNYELWISGQQIGEFNNGEMCCGDSTMNPYFRIERLYCPIAGLPAIIAFTTISIILIIVAILVPKLRENFQSIITGIILFDILIYFLLRIISPLFSKNKIHKKKSLNIFSLSDNTKIATVYSTTEGWCKSFKCLCEIECYRELNQYQTMALISSILVKLCNLRGEQNSSV